MLGIDVNYLYVVHLSGGKAGGYHLAYLTASEYEYTAYFQLVLPQVFHEGGHAVTAADDIKVISRLEGGIKLWNYCGITPGDSYNAEFGPVGELGDGLRELCHGHVQKGGVVVQFEYAKLEFSAGKIKSVRGGR